MTCDFQQCGILISVYSYEPVQPPFKFRTSKRCSVSSLTLIEYSSDEQRLLSDCAYSQADLSLCWSHIPHCWKYHALAQLYLCYSTTEVAVLYFILYFCLLFLLLLLLLLLLLHIQVLHFTNFTWVCIVP